MLLLDVAGESSVKKNHVQKLGCMRQKGRPEKIQTFQYYKEPELHENFEMLERDPEVRDYFSQGQYCGMLDEAIRTEVTKDGDLIKILISQIYYRKVQSSGSCLSGLL